MIQVDDNLERAIRDAQVQLKQMWVLRVRMERVARAATFGAAIGLTATTGLSGALAWLLSRLDVPLHFERLSSQLLVAIGLIATVLCLTGYLWLRRIEALSGAAALEVEIDTIRSEVQRAASVRDRIPSANGGA